MTRIARAALVEHAFGGVAPIGHATHLRVIIDPDPFQHDQG